LIEELLTGRRAPGVYRWQAERREAARGVTEAERAGRRVFWLDGSGVRDKRAFLGRCAEEFSLPSYFGHNWDALQDCLIDLSWAPATRGYLVVYDHWRELAEADPEAYRTAVEIFESAAEYWRDRPTPMAVLLLSEPEEPAPPSA
jgi:RNAse (barnase) inhibitor barstar